MAPAMKASMKVARKRPAMSSSLISLPKLSATSYGSGTMKPLMTPTRMRASTAAIAATSVPSPSASGAMRSRRGEAVMMYSESTTTSWPGLARPSTSLPQAKEDVDARIRGHDGGESCGAPAQMRLVVEHAAAGFLAQVVPDLRDVAAEGFA